MNSADDDSASAAITKPRARRGFSRMRMNAASARSAGSWTLGSLTGLAFYAIHGQTVDMRIARRRFLQVLGAALPAASIPWLAACEASPAPSAAHTPSRAAPAVMKRGERVPVLFVGHGSPINAITDNAWSRGFRALAHLLPQPRAIVVVSAHWYATGTFLTGNAAPKTIHDFSGFPRELTEMQYPAPGDPALAARIVKLLGPERASLRNDWGLDHGAWTVLHHLQPDASCPVVQLSLDERLAPEQHLALGKLLAPLRDEGVLVLGSGNVTHNLGYAMRSMRNGDASTPAWAASFDAEVEHACLQHDGAALARFLDSDAGRMSHPTPDHYLPLLYAAAATQTSDAVTFPIQGFDGGSLSMRAVLFG
jgi:4,5-DOPA dioxygenase extradiol